MLNLWEEIVLKTAYCNEVHKLPTDLFSFYIMRGGFLEAVGVLVINDSTVRLSQQPFQQNSKQPIISETLPLPKIPL